MSIFEISIVFSIPERQHLTGELIGSFEQGQSPEEQSSPAGTVMRKRVFGKAYLSHWLTWCSRCAKSGRENSLQLDNLGCQLFQNTFVFSCVCWPPTVWKARQNTARNAARTLFSPRWIQTENCPCPDCLEVESLGSKWQKGIMQKVLSVT